MQLRGMTPERGKRIEDVLAKRQPDLTVVLENVNDPHNISAVMRTCDAVGIREIFVLNNRIARHKKWGAKSSSSAHKWLTVHQFDNTAECAAALRASYSQIFTTHLSSDAADLYALDLTAPTALIFGNEHDGITAETLAISDGNFIIPQVGMIHSLNISVACAVTVYEAFRQKSNAGHFDSVKLAGDEIERLWSEWSGKNEQ